MYDITEIIDQLLCDTKNKGDYSTTTKMYLNLSQDEQFEFVSTIMFYTYSDTKAGIVKNQLFSYLDKNNTVAKTSIVDNIKLLLKTFITETNNVKYYYSSLFKLSFNVVTAKLTAIVTLDGVKFNTNFQDYGTYIDHTEEEVIKISKKKFNEYCEKHNIQDAVVEVSCDVNSL